MSEDRSMNTYLIVVFVITLVVLLSVYALQSLGS